MVHLQILKEIKYGSSFGIHLIGTGMVITTYTNEINRNGQTTKTSSRFINGNSDNFCLLFPWSAACFCKHSELLSHSLQYFVRRSTGTSCMGTCQSNGAFWLQAYIVRNPRYILGQHLFSFSHCPTSEEAEDAHKAGRGTARTAGSNCPKGYPVTCGVMLSNENYGEVFQDCCCSGAGWTLVIWRWTRCFVCLFVFYTTCFSWFCIVFTYLTVFNSIHEFLTVALLLLFPKPTPLYVCLYL